MIVNPYRLYSALSNAESILSCLWDIAISLPYKKSR
jgi:hypothetical protein